MRILLLADLHVCAEGVLHNGVVDTTEELRTTLRGIPRRWEPEAFVVAGDVSNDDTRESYERAFALVDAHAQGCPVLWIPGNHDANDEFGLLHQLSRGHHARGVVTVGETSFALLDTRVEGKGFGRLDDAARGTLTELAAAPGEHVVVMHHPPLPAPSGLHHSLRLRDVEEMADEFAAAHPTVILSGHYHLAGVHSWHGIPVVCGAPSANHTTLEHGWQVEAACARHGATLLETSAPGDARFLWHGTGAELFCLSHEQVLAVGLNEGNPAEPGGGYSDSPEVQRAGSIWR